MPKPHEPFSEEAMRAEVRRLMSELGVRAVADLIGLHPQTALALGAGAPVRNGTLAIAREFFARRPKQQHAAHVA